MKENVDGEDDDEASKIQTAMAMCSLCEFPLQIYSGDEVSFVSAL
jgi:hypothetical protein